jgi:hypothetical protein
MGNFSATLLVLVLAIVGIVLTVLLLAVSRETLFWYWRTKGILKEPKDILNQTHETALFIRKNIAGLKAADSAAGLPAAKPAPPMGMDMPV